MTIRIEQPQRWNCAIVGDGGPAGSRPWLSAIDLGDPAIEEGDGMMMLTNPAPTAAEVDALLTRMHALSLDMAAMAHRLVQGVDQGCASPAMVLDAMVHGEASAKLAKALASSLGARTHRRPTQESLEWSAAA
jgi:uncharacterized protein (DUF885 family)